MGLPSSGDRRMFGVTEPATATAPEEDDVGSNASDLDTNSSLLARAVTELGGTPREGQQKMVEAITSAVASGQHLLVQAGTGTGKSLGYLVPAIHHAVKNNERVLVSTATLALQRQVITRDLPLVAKALTPSLSRAPRLALLKGWQNYVCAHKVAGGYPPEDSAALFDLEPGAGQTPVASEHPAQEQGATSLGEEIVRARAWAQETTSGDRDDLVPGVSDRAWRQVSVTTLECIGQKCPMLSECFPEQARVTARAADVVVTNHAMLGIAAEGASKVLPEYNVLVVDEAHELTDRITQQSTAELSAASIESAARLARRYGGVATPQLDAAGASLGAALMDLPEGRFPQGLPDNVLGAVQAVRDASRDLLTELKPNASDKASPGESGLKTAHATVNVLFDIAERMSQDPTGHDVLWSSRASGDSQWRDAGITRLYVAPLNVSGLVRTHLLGERVGIFTSATLNLGGTFEPVARSLGLTGPTAERHTDTQSTADWSAIDVGTPFDYAKQGILYIAKGLPAPGREAATEAQLDEIAELISASGGRTLGLFSSRRAAHAVTAAMRDRLDLPILCQGDDQLPALVQQFGADPRTCLFGTLSLWQGVDVPGQTCQLVLIDRIPFPRPDDPIRSARSEAIAAAGGNGFMQVSATHAALLLAQGAGRLIRTAQDRGVVAVLDPRLATARYATFLTRSMPGLWQTTDRDIVTSALKRLLVE